MNASNINKLYEARRHFERAVQIIKSLKEQPGSTETSKKGAWEHQMMVSAICTGEWAIDYLMAIEVNNPPKAQ